MTAQQLATDIAFSVCYRVYKYPKGTMGAFYHDRDIAASIILKRIETIFAKAEMYDKMITDINDDLI